MAEILKGKVVADFISEDVKKEVKLLKKKGITPKLTIMRVGGRSDDLAYERGVIKRCEKVELAVETKELPEGINNQDFLKHLKAVNEDKGVHGILVFRPLPSPLKEDEIKYGIAPEKDVDCFNPINSAKLMEGDITGFLPCTPAAVMEILKYYHIPITGKRAVVLGRSMVVGKPLSLLLLNENATVTICHSRTENIEKITKEADILISAIGKAKYVRSSFVKEGAVIIDVGINLDGEGKLVGDMDFESCEEKAAKITPVPGGVGSVTTSILAKQVVKACKIQNNL